MITNEIIKNFLNCPYKAFLKFNHKSGDVTEFEQLECELLNRSRVEFHKKLQSKLSEHQIVHQAPGIKEYNVTEAIYILHPAFQTKEFSISFDAINAFPNHQPLNKVLYVPIEVITKETVSKIEKLVFAIKCFIWSEIQKITFRSLILV